MTTIMYFQMYLWLDLKMQKLPSITWWLWDSDHLVWYHGMWCHLEDVQVLSNTDDEDFWNVSDEDFWNESDSSEADNDNGQYYEEPKVQLRRLSDKPSCLPGTAILVQKHKNNKNTKTNTNTQILKANTQIQIHKYKYINENTAIQIHKYK